MEGQRSKDHGERRHRGQPPKDGRSRIHRIIRDRIVGSKWFGRFVMFVIILNSIVLWPWTDAVKHTDHLSSDNVYPVVNNFFILVYVVEFILKVCQRRCHSLLVD